MDENIQEGATVPLPEPQRGSEPVVPEPTAPAWAPAAEAAPPAPEAYAAAPVYEPTPAPVSPAEHKRYSISSRTLAIIGGVLGGLLLLAITFGVGVQVGAHAGRFDRGVGGMMPYGQGMPNGTPNGERGWQNDQRGDGPGGWQNDQRGSVPNYGGRGNGFHQAVPSPDTTSRP